MSRSQNAATPTLARRGREERRSLTVTDRTEPCAGEQAAGVPDHHDLQLGERILRSRATGLTLAAAARLHNVDEQTAFAAASRELVERARWGREVRS